MAASYNPPAGGSGGGSGGVTTFVGLTDTSGSAGADDQIVVWSGGNLVNADIVQIVAALSNLFMYTETVASAPASPTWNTILNANHGLNTPYINVVLFTDDGTNVTREYNPEVRVNKTTFDLEWRTAASFSGDVNLVGFGT